MLQAFSAGERGFSAGEKKQRPGEKAEAVRKNRGRENKQRPQRPGEKAEAGRKSRGREKKQRPGEKARHRDLKPLARADSSDGVRHARDRRGADVEPVVRVLRGRHGRMACDESVACQPATVFQTVLAVDATCAAIRTSRLRATCRRGAVSEQLRSQCMAVQRLAHRRPSPYRRRTTAGRPRRSSCFGSRSTGQRHMERSARSCYW